MISEVIIYHLKFDIFDFTKTDFRPEFQAIEISDIYRYVIGAGKTDDSTEAVCATPKVEMDELKKLGRDIHSVLNALKLTHVLIYGS